MRKLVEYDYTTRVASVYHMGYHKCWPKVGSDTEQLLGHVQKPAKRKGSAKEVAVEEICSFIDTGDMDGAEREADVWVDRRKVKRTIESLKPNAGADENSFDAVALLKQKTDKKDIFYIYQIGNVKYGNTCDHVFKSSWKMAEIAIAMDVDREDNMLQLENAYFDATHSRVQYFKSLGMWLIHPTMKKVIHLVSMEICSESHEDIALFLNLFNHILEEVKGIEGYKFNPRYFVCDEAGANYKAIALVYGQDLAARRVKGCQWHFKLDVEKHMKQVHPQDQESFRTTCFDMCEVTTVADYNPLKAKLDEIVLNNPEINPFIIYWHPCRSHMFKPFRGAGLPSVNMSEQGNKSFKPSSSKAMRLVNAAKYDVATMLYQERELNLFEQNLVKASGRGMLAAARLSRDHAEQMKVAEDFGNIFENEEDVMLEAEEANNPSMYILKAMAKHRVPQGKRGRKKGGAVQRKITGTKQKNVKKTDGSTGVDTTTEAVDIEKVLEEKLTLAMEITNSELITERRNKVDNPPVIIIANWRVTQYKGCRKGISKEEKKYPHNLVIRRRGVVGYFNHKLHKWIDTEANVHFHLNMNCQRKNDPSIEKRHFVCNDEDFCQLDLANMEVLHAAGFLKPIVEKKME